MLWVWPDSSPDASTSSSAASPALIAELDSEEWQPRTGWFRRDLPISFETVVENVRPPGGGEGSWGNGVHEGTGRGEGGGGGDEGQWPGQDE